MTRDEQIKAVEGIIKGRINHIWVSECKQVNEYRFSMDSLESLATAVVDALGVDEENVKKILDDCFDDYMIYEDSKTVAVTIANNKEVIKIEPKEGK